MRVAAADEREQLKQLVAHQYGLAIRRWRLIPKGEVGRSYILETKAGTRFFLKVYPAVLALYGTPFDPLADLRLQHAIRHTLGVPNVPRLLLTTEGELAARFPGGTCVLQEFIAGGDLSDRPLTDAEIATLGSVVGAIHRRSKALDPKALSLPTEDYDVTFPLRLRPYLAALDARQQGIAGREQVRAALLPYRERLRQHLDELEAVRAAVWSTERPLVVTHGDVHGGNLLHDSAGALYIADWELSVLAPAEREVWGFVDCCAEVFLPTYAAAAGQVALDATLLAYYALWRELADIAEYVARITDQQRQPTSPRQQRYHLQQLDRCLREMPDADLPQRITCLTRRLAAGGLGHRGVSPEAHGC